MTEAVRDAIGGADGRLEPVPEVDLQGIGVVRLFRVVAGG